MFYAARRAHWAKRHTFVLKTPGWVTVSIDNSAANTEPLDTYAVLLKDDDNKGTVIARNDNASRRRTDARLADVFLLPGSYTIEATTKQPQTAGSYDITVEAVVSGLADSYTATVGTPKTITFRYWPPDAQIAVKTAAAEEFGLTVTTRSAAGDGYGTAAIALTPRLVHDHELTVRVSSASAAGRLISFKLNARCPTAPPVPNGPTLTTSTHNEVLCVKTGTSDPAPKASFGPWGSDIHYEVTPGALNGILESARAAIAARSDTATCGLTPNKLAAFMLSVGHHEIRNTYETVVDGSYKHTFRPRTPARSAMALSRKDLGPTLVQAPGESDAEFKKRWVSYEGRMHLYSDDARLTGPARAFFHPGVGWWQIDDAGEWPYLNHGQRSETGLGLNGEFDSTGPDSGGEAVAKKLANLYCDDSGGAAALRELFRGSTWYGCRSGGCFDSYENLYLENSDDLYVTISEENSQEYSTSGGVTAHRCRWDNAGAGDPFSCFFHDPDRSGREGWMADWASSTRGVTTSPLAAGFVSFSYDGRRFAVFPGAILETFESGSISTRYKSVPERENAREKKPGEVVDGAWSSGSYNLGTTAAPQQARLEIEVCVESEWVKPGGAHCGDWHSVDDDGIADTLGVQAQ